MFENEGTEIESTQSDVTEDSSSESQSDAQPAQQNAAPAKEEQRIPYERFQEMVAKRQEAEARMQQYEQRMAEMERQFRETQRPKEEPKDPMYDRLKGIDPEFADYVKGLSTRAAKAEALEQRLEQFERQQFANSAVSKFESLNKANNVSPELAQLYKSELELAYANGKIKDLSHMEQAYKSIHERTQKFLQAQERATIEKYTASKKKDASAPTAQGRGKAPVQGQKTEFSKDPREAKAQLIKNIAGALRAGRDV